MKQLRLSPRLALVASLVEPGTVAADVGTDHAYVPIRLLLSGVCPRAYATDLRPGPLARAREDARRWGVEDRLTLLLCDGLALCPSDAVDAVILAGMGGETMASILSGAPWAREKRLILQPQSKLPLLRRALAAQGLAVADAFLAADAGRVYPVWLAAPGEGEPERAVDLPLLERRDPLLRPWLDESIKRLGRELLGMRAARVPDASAIAEAEAELEQLREARKETLTW